ncbi:MAG: hypothetical protein ACLT4D_03550 [Blautia faecis]
MVEKSMNVYLPYGYDDNKEYDVLYLLHRAEDLVLDWGQLYWKRPQCFGQYDSKERMQTGHCSISNYSPLCLGVPIWNRKNCLTRKKSADQWPMYFWKELRNDIIPLVESEYSTYAQKM